MEFKISRTTVRMLRDLICFAIGFLAVTTPVRLNQEHFEDFLVVCGIVIAVIIIARYMAAILYFENTKNTSDLNEMQDDFLFFGWGIGAVILGLLLSGGNRSLAYIVMGFIVVITTIIRLGLCYGKLLESQKKPADELTPEP